MGTAEKKGENFVKIPNKQNQEYTVEEIRMKYIRILDIPITTLMYFVNLRAYVLNLMYFSLSNPW